jgi:L-ribulose-5-phosphate 4-epimerase
MRAQTSGAAAIRRGIIDTYAKLSDMGYMIGTWGNVSVRIGEAFLITPSRVPTSEMRPADIVLVGLDGAVIEGSRLPSSEMELHRALYLRRRDIDALVHTHAPFASIMAAMHRPIPVVAEDMAQIIGGRVNCSEYSRGGMHEELGRKATQAIGDEAMAVLLANHGPIVGGRTLDEALVASAVLEKAAQCALFAAVLGGMREIAPEDVRAERDRFLYKYGTAQDTQD